jgi:flagellar FliJ protein
VNEQRAATASPEYAITYESYAKAVILRRKNLVGSIAETDEQIEVAVTEVQEAHREMRKYEIAEERAQKREQAEEDRVEQADMEEIASTQFRMRSDSRVR